MLRAVRTSFTAAMQRQRFTSHAVSCFASGGGQRRFQSSAPPSGGEYAHITKSLVWGLWNEGNLFSLSLPELQFYLDENYFATAPEKKSLIDFHKKSVLVRQVEELLSAEQQQQVATITTTTTASAAATIASGGHSTMEGNMYGIHITDYDRVDDGLDEADEYGDWGAEPGFDMEGKGPMGKGKNMQRRKVDYLEISPLRMGERYDVLAPRSYQLLHSDITADLVLQEVKGACKLPGQSRRTEPAFTVKKAAVDDANRNRFKKAFEWSLLNIWNLNLTASELNINAGRVLFYAQLAKQNKNIFPIFSLQSHIYSQHPYVFFSIATERNRALLERVATESLGMTLTQDETTSYKVTIRRGNLGAQTAAPVSSGLADMFLDCELNDSLSVTGINRPWDRLFVMHYVRSASPDLRFVVRSRHPLKKRVADLFLGDANLAGEGGGSSVLKFTRDSVQSILSPELGEIFYCCERKIRKWSRTSEKTGVTISLVETKRTPLIISKIGDEGERLEYEFVVSLPQKGEKVSVSDLGDEVWELGRTLATSMEEGMADLSAYAVSTTASFY